MLTRGGGAVRGDLRAVVLDSRPYMGDYEYTPRDRLVFDWDEGNRPKIERRYPAEEVESVFADADRIEARAYDKAGERRFAVLGRSSQGRLIFVAYTYRGDAVRILSARHARDYERRQYEESGR